MHMRYLLKRHDLEPLKLSHLLQADFLQVSSCESIIFSENNDHHALSLVILHERSSVSVAS